MESRLHHSSRFFEIGFTIRIGESRQSFLPEPVGRGLRMFWWWLRSLARRIFLKPVPLHTRVDDFERYRSRRLPRPSRSEAEFERYRQQRIEGAAPPPTQDKLGGVDYYFPGEKFAPRRPASRRLSRARGGDTAFFGVSPGQRVDIRTATRQHRGSLE